MENTWFCSVIIPTIGRSTLERSIQSVLCQEFDRAGFEIIVVNDSGMPLSNGSWLVSEQVRVLNTARRERSFARNSGAAIAQGTYLLFLDDDDWLLPGALEAYWQLANQHPQAVWLYGGIRIVNEKGETLGEINSGLSGNCFAQIIGGAWAPLQSSLLRAQTFFRLGGFNPEICGTEDEDLCRRFAFSGDFANTPVMISCLLRGPSWSTSTNYLRAPQDTRFSRDKVIAENGSFRRLFSAQKSGYWYGRICRVYISTMNWNIRQRRIFTALSRGVFGAAAFIRSGFRILRRDFWKGFRADHVPDTLHFVMLNYELEGMGKPTEGESKEE
jgi:glycosyltransferase involved in cell wall biosynthesis